MAAERGQAGGADSKGEEVAARAQAGRSDAAEVARSADILAKAALGGKMGSTETAEGASPVGRYVAESASEGELVAIGATEA